MIGKIMFYASLAGLIIFAVVAWVLAIIEVIRDRNWLILIFILLPITLFIGMYLY